MPPSRRRADEPRARHRDDHCRLGGRGLLSRRHRGSPALSRYADPTARAHQSRQRRPRSGGARAPAAGREPARRLQADLRLAARAGGGGDGLPAHCARRAGERSERPTGPLDGACRGRRGTAHMTIASALEMALAAVVLGMAMWTIVARETFAAAVGFVVYGLLLALVWVRLDAVDVALTEAAIGGGLSGVLLLGAAARLRASETRAAAERPGGIMRLGAAALSATVAAAFGASVLLLPDAAPTLAPAAAANAVATGLGNPVTNVLMAFRATDTLLEKVVLLLALVGVWSLAPDRLWGGYPGARHQADPLGTLAFLARLLPPVGIVVGIYVVWAGANYPGGAFPGGTILAAMWLLVIM